MKLILVFAMLVCTEAQTTTQSNRRTVCTHGKTYPHRECQKYYRCDRGQFVVETCDFLKVYSKSLKKCVYRYSRNDDCTPKTTTTTDHTTTKDLMTTSPGCVHGKTYPNLHDCQHYYSCYKGWLALETCDNGSVYSSSVQHCVSLDSPDDDCESNESEIEQAAITTTTETPDKGNDKDWPFKIGSTTTTKTIERQPTPDSFVCVHGETYFHPSKCHLYYLCYNGLMLVENCSFDLVYSRSSKQCVSPTSPDNDCDSIIIEMQNIDITTADTGADVTDGDNNSMQRTTITTKVSTTTTTEEAVLSHAQNCTDRVAYKDKRECRKYYYCNSGKLEHRTCFLGFVFSQKLNQCVPRSSRNADCKPVAH